MKLRTSKLRKGSNHRQISTASNQQLIPTKLEQDPGYSPNGLTQAEVETRLSQFGYNEIEENKPNPYLKFLSYF